MGAALHDTGHATTTLTPDCDPDLSHCGRPAGGAGSGGGLRSTAVLGVLLVAGAALAAAQAVPGAVAFLAGAVALVSALALAVRGIRVVDRVADRVGHGAAALAVSRPSRVLLVRRSRAAG